MIGEAASFNTDTRDRGMTEAELLETSQFAFSNSLATFTIYVTLLSGYLAAAYLVGSKLIGSQIAIINVLYSLVMLTLMAACVSFSQVGYENSFLALELSTRRNVGPLPFVTELAAIIMIFCYLASLKFMWDIRRSKSD
jgi:hypothetical protein